MGTELSAEIQELLDVGGGPVGPEPEPKPEPELEVKAKAEPSPEPEPEPQPEPSPEPVPEPAPGVEPEPEPGPAPVTEATIEEQLAQLRLENAKLMGQLEMVRPKEEEPTEPTQDEPVVGFEAEPEIQDLSFIPGDASDLFEPAGLNKALNAVHRASVEATQQRFDHLLQVLPQIMSKQIQDQTQLMSTAEEFYRRNEDLRSVSKYVGFVANQVKARNPKASLREVLEITEKEVREQLKTPKKEVGAGPVTKPAVPATTQRATKRPSKEQLSSLQKEIDALLT